MVDIMVMMVNVLLLLYQLKLVSKELFLIVSKPVVQIMLSFSQFLVKVISVQVVDKYLLI
jgi:hypothetical protein